MLHYVSMVILSSKVKNNPVPVLKLVEKKTIYNCLPAAICLLYPKKISIHFVLIFCSWNSRVSTGLSPFPQLLSVNQFMLHQWASKLYHSMLQLQNYPNKQTQATMLTLTHTYSIPISMLYIFLFLLTKVFREKESYYLVDGLRWCRMIFVTIRYLPGIAHRQIACFVPVTFWEIKTMDKTVL